MSKLDRFNEAKNDYTTSQGWASMLGKTYYGGTSGQGAPGRLVYLALSLEDMRTPTIYYQHSDGATNYHKCPRSLLPHLEAEIALRFPEILAAALARQECVVKEAAGQAADEYRNLIAAAGISVNVTVSAA